MRKNLDATRACPQVAEMAKTKSKAILSVADGAGGMMEVKDCRFEKRDWPIRFEVPVEQERTIGRAI
jgi:hypothetical protein